MSFITAVRNERVKQACDFQPACDSCALAKLPETVAPMDEGEFN